MRRRVLIIALGLAMAWPIAANGQQDARALRSQILLMQSECIADKLAEFIKEVQNQVDWTTQLPSTGGSIEQRRFDALRLLREAPRDYRDFATRCRGQGVLQGVAFSPGGGWQRR